LNSEWVVWLSTEVKGERSPAQRTLDAGGSQYAGRHGRCCNGYLDALPCQPVYLVTSRGIKTGHGSMLIGTGSLSRSGLPCLVELMTSAAKVGRLTCG
jgi:hypothetical protein